MHSINVMPLLESCLLLSATDINDITFITETRHCIELSSRTLNLKSIVQFQGNSSFFLPTLVSIFASYTIALLFCLILF